jgi:hypothetical protein
MQVNLFKRRIKYFVANGTQAQLLVFYAYERKNSFMKLGNCFVHQQSYIH